MKTLIFIILAVMCFLQTANAQIGDYALDLDGNDDHVVVPHNVAFNVQAVSIEFWFFWERTNLPAAVEFIVGKDVEGLEVHTGGGAGHNALRFIPTVGVYLDTPPYSFESMKWNHAAFTYDPSGSGAVSCYINGKEVNLTSQGPNPITSPIVNSLSNFFIGQRADNMFRFFGKIDELRIWNDVRTPEEIRSNMYKELAGTESGLVAYYKMSNGTGTTLSDNGPNSINGTLTGGAAWKLSGCFAGSRGALNFDGVDTYISLGNPSELNYSGTSEMSFESWVNVPNFGSTYRLFSKNHSFAPTVQYIFEINSDGKLNFSMDKFNTGWQNVFTSENAIPLNKWVHIALIKTATTASAYVNGVLFATGNIDATRQSATASTTGEVRIASIFDTPGNFYKGKMDEVRIWSKALTEVEIRSNMFKNMVGNEADLVVYYNFNEGAGSTVYDLTSNSIHGTLINSDNSDWVTSGAFTTWLGTEHSAWLNNANWSDSAPTNGANVGILNFSLPHAGYNSPVLIMNPTFNNCYVSSTAPLGMLSNLYITGNMFLYRDIDLNGYTLYLSAEAYLYEIPNTVGGINGTISTIRQLSDINAENVAGLGAIITTQADMGSVTIRRKHINSTVYGDNSITRLYEINPENNTGLDATLVFNYRDSELNGQTEVELVLYKSTNSGVSWIAQGGEVDAALNTITISGINSFSMWTASSTDIQITLTTDMITNIGGNYATSGGNITDDGGTVILESGICWNTAGTPTVSDTRSTDGITSIGTFVSQLSDLDPYQVYYVRAYATNHTGTYYGNEIGFTTVPTLGEWGLIALGSLTALLGGWFVYRRFV